MKTLFIFTLVCLGLLRPSFAEEAAPVLRLSIQNQPVVLPEGTEKLVCQQIMALVRSSNFHSGPGDKYHIFSFAGVQQDYRDAIAAGEYAVVSLSPAQKISTLEGDVTAAEIVVGLKSPEGKNCLFTIDGSGTVVSHAKYSGEILLKLRKAIATTDP